MTLRTTNALGAVALLIVAGAAFALWTGRAEPADLPEDAAQVSPSAEFANAAESADYYREWLRREPDAVEPRVRLAQVLLQLAQENGDEAAYIPEAEALLAEALEREPEHYYALTLQASLLNKLHRFEDARDLSRRLIARFPQHSYTHGTLVDALVELGEYDEAVAASDRLQQLRPGLPAYARASYLRELHGDGEGAIAAMRLAVDAESPGRLARNWAALKLGELYLGAAQPDTAAYVFDKLLDEAPGFTPARAALGHVALVRGDAAEAVRLLEAARAERPSETTDELLVEAYTALGDTDRAQAAAGRVLASLHAAREMGEIVDMEEADFLADADRELPRALTMATAQQARRPGHLHANETLAWALYKNGRAAEAVPYIERAMRLGTGDAMVHYRAGRIFEAAGQAGEAARHLQAALDGHLGVESPSAAADARARLARAV